MQLTKSDYLLYLKHPCWLWLKKNDKSKLPPIDEALQARFDAGFEFETYAESLFPGAAKVGFNSYAEYLAMPQKTAKLIESGIKIILQPRFEVGELTCICDVVKFVSEKEIELYEIKSSTKPSATHEHDLAFQAVVLENSGFTVKSCHVIYVNKDFVRKGGIDPKEISIVTDISTAVFERMKATREDIKRALKCMHKSEMPNPSPKYCRLNCENEWIAIYKSLVGITAGEGTIYDLFNPKANLILELEDRGIERLVDIPEELLDPKRAWQLKALKEGTHIDQKKINKFLNSLEYPLYFLDYETLASVTPPFDGYKPYQQIPFQYSLHVIERPGAQTKHVEYLHSENSDPVPPLSCSLQENIGSKGSILVWYEDFEKTCNLAMGKIAPEFKDFYSDVNTRIVDLMTPFSKFHYVDAAFGGSASIKKVLPVLVPELSHSVLDISEGATAQRLWMEAILEGKHADKKEKILKDLWDYCELDTLAMVKIWEFLANNFSEETNKPKENIQQALF